MLAISGKRRLLLDKDGSVARLLSEIEAFRWEDLQEAANAQVSWWMMLVLSELNPHLGKAVTHLLCSSSKKSVEQGALADELPLLRCTDYQETIEENQTWLHDVLLSSLPLHLQ